jgi:hypothetical protein
MSCFKTCKKIVSEEIETEKQLAEERIIKLIEEKIAPLIEKKIKELLEPKEKGETQLEEIKVRV